jgi:hypothetical protein
MRGTTIGITFAEAKITNPRQSRPRSIEVEFLIDTGAIYSVIPAATARE